MQAIQQIYQTNPNLAKTIEERGGFITSDQTEQLTQINRFLMVLVRTGNGRFTTPIQNLNHFIKVIEKSGMDYVRDVSLPA